MGSKKGLSYLYCAYEPIPQLIAGRWETGTNVCQSLFLGQFLGNIQCFVQAAK